MLLSSPVAVAIVVTLLVLCILLALGLCKVAARADKADDDTYTGLTSGLKVLDIPDEQLPESLRVPPTPEVAPAPPVMHPGLRRYMGNR